MKKIFAIMGAALFMLGFGIAYADELNNGVTDFSGRSYDSLEIAPAMHVEHAAFEGTAAGGMRQNCGSEESSVITFDSLPINAGASVGKVAKGSAGLHGNCGGEKSSVITYDSVPIRW